MIISGAWRSCTLQILVVVARNRDPIPQGAFLAASSIGWTLIRAVHPHAWRHVVCNVSAQEPHWRQELSMSLRPDDVGEGRLRVSLRNSSSALVGGLLIVISLTAPCKSLCYE